MACAATLRPRAVRAGLGGLGLGIGLTLLFAPHAAAEPENTPADPPPPLAAVAPMSVLSADVAQADVPAVPADAAQAVPAATPLAADPAEGVPHLPTPDNLPPGTTQAPSEGSKLGYIRDLWHAVRTQDVTMSDALLLFTQRPMDADTPVEAMSPRSAPIVLPDPAAPPVADAPIMDAPIMTELPAPPAP